MTDCEGRYLVLLLNGGVYTDTDTACVRSIKDWGTNADLHTTSPLISALPTLLSLLESDRSCHDDSPSSASTCSPTISSSNDQAIIKDQPPNMILALEMDAPHMGNDWREETFARGIQVVQWTLLSQAYHPILLDVLGRALRTARNVRESRLRKVDSEFDDTKVEIPNIVSPLFLFPPSLACNGHGFFVLTICGNQLEWTGPGVFTDAVLRYLLVRHGLHPRQLSGLAKPLRIGDVV